MIWIPLNTSRATTTWLKLQLTLFSSSPWCPLWSASGKTLMLSLTQGSKTSGIIPLSSHRHPSTKGRTSSRPRRERGATQGEKSRPQRRGKTKVRRVSRLRRCHLAAIYCRSTTRRASQSRDRTTKRLNKMFKRRKMALNRAGRRDRTNKWRRIR